MKHQQRKRLSFSSLVSHSLILPLFYRIAVYLYQSVRESAVGQFFCGYDRSNDAVQNGLFAALRKKLSLSDRFLRPLRFAVARQFDSSATLNLVRSVLNHLSGLQLGTYGIAVLIFSLFSALSYALRFAAGGDPSVTDLVIAGAFLLIGICLVASNAHLSEALCKSSMTSFFLFTVAGADEEYFRSVPNCRGRAWVAACIGALMGIAALFIGPLWITIGCIGLIAAFLVYKTPEFGAVSTLFFAPFLPTKVMIALMVYLLACFFVKFFRGKRTIHFEWMDVTVLLFGIVFLCAGIFSASPADSLFPVMVYICFMCGYFLIVNLIRSSEWIHRCYLSVLSSATLVALYGVYQNFFVSANTTWQDTDMFGEATGRVVSTLENPNVLAEYLIMILPIAVVGFLTQKSLSGKMLYLFSGGILCACLIFTWSRGAWLGILIAMMLFLLMYSKKILVAGLFGVLAVPFLPFVLPQSVLDRFLSIGNLGDTSTSYRVHIWEGTLNMLRDHFLGGIGVGTGVFGEIYPRYSLSGIESAPHSHNLYLQILVETGILGLILFLIVLFTFVRHNFTFFAKPLPTVPRLHNAALFCGILAVLAQGMTDYIWYNYRVYLVFWLMIGLTVATARTALRENQTAQNRTAKGQSSQAELDIFAISFSKHASPESTETNTNNRGKESQ